MLDLALDGIVALLPAVIALLSVVVGIRLAKNPSDESHRPLWWTIVGLIKHPDHLAREGQVGFRVIPHR